MNHIEKLKATLSKIETDPSGSKVATETCKAIHKIARPASPPPARPGTGKPASKKPDVRKLEASGSLRKLKV